MKKEYQKPMVSVINLTVYPQLLQSSGKKPHYSGNKWNWG